MLMIKCRDNVSKIVYIQTQSLYASNDTLRYPINTVRSTFKSIWSLFNFILTKNDFEAIVLMLY